MKKILIILGIALVASVITNIWFYSYWLSVEYPSGEWDYCTFKVIQNRDCDGSPCTNFIKARNGDKLYFEYYCDKFKPEMFKPVWDDGFNCYMMPCYTIKYHTEDRHFCVGEGTYKTTVIDEVYRSGSYSPFDNVTYISGYVCNEKIYVNGEFIRWSNCSK